MHARRRRAVAAMATVALTAAVPATARAAGDDWPPPGGEGPCAVTKKANVPVPMRDGTILRADVYRPRTDGQGAGDPLYRYRIKVWPTSNLFRAGDAVRLEISSSDFPQFDANLNTGAPFGTTSRSRPAHQTILHDARHPSEVTLPVIPPHGDGATSFPYVGG